MRKGKKKQHRNSKLPIQERRTVDTLTGMQRIFKDRWLVHFNATRAATEAGYSNPDKAGSRLLKNPKIKAAIDEALSALVMERDEVLRILSSQARAEHTNYLKIARPQDFPQADDSEEVQQKKAEVQAGRIYLTGQIYLDVAQILDEGKGYLLKDINENQHGPQVKFPDQQTAVIWLGKHYKLFTDIVQTDRNAELDAALDAINQTTEIDL